MEKNGEITDNSYLELLNEIEDSDIASDESQKASEERIEEQLAKENEENTEIEAYFGESAWRSLNGAPCLIDPSYKEKKVAAQRAKMQANKDARLAIQRYAFNQSVLPLNSAIPNSNKSLLISLLVKDYDEIITNKYNYINARIRALLSCHIPQRIKSCALAYPDSIRKSPGFLYRASQEYGRGLLFWASPDIPYYFTQNTEQQILTDNYDINILAQIDRAIVIYYDYKQKSIDRQVKIASKLLENDTQTYFDLLRLNPFWFDILYKHFNTENNNEQKNVITEGAAISD